MSDHAAAKAALQQSGVAFTSLRNGFYIERTAVSWHGVPDRVIALLQDGPVSRTAHADLAEAAAIAFTLTKEGSTVLHRA
jgi:NAD(P)H dehydrogenase (quinone)